MRSTPMLSRVLPGRAFVPALLAAAVLLPLVPAGAQMIPPHPGLGDFEPMGEYLLVVGGAPLPGVKMYRSEKAGAAVLMVGPGIKNALLLMPREKAVQRVEPAHAGVGGDGRASLAPDGRAGRA